MLRQFKSGYPVIDRVQEIIKGKSIRAIKSVSLSEDFFSDHFPRFPILPGVMQLEGMVQVGSLLVSVSNDFKYIPKAHKINGVKFRNYVKAGDVLVFEAQIISLGTDTASVITRATVNEKIVSSAKHIAFTYLPLTDEQIAKEKEWFEYSGGSHA